MLKFFIVGFILLAIIIPSKSVYSLASVGIGTGKIEVKTPLVPNTAKTIDSVVVYNDGDETASFEMTVMFNETQAELKPNAEWISFSPQNFELGAGASQIVEVTITLPQYAQTGEYFAYLEATIAQKNTSKNGSTNITATAATKLLFTVATSIELAEQPLDTPKNAPFISNTPILFENMGDFSVTSTVTINKLLAISPIL